MGRLSSRLSAVSKEYWKLMGLSLFWLAWSVGSYQTLYLQNIGFTASQIGLLNSISSAVAIAAISFWGMVSDKTGRLRLVVIVILAGGAVLYALVPLIPTSLSFSPLLLICLLPVAHFFRGAKNSFVENLMVRNCNELNLNYGLPRGCGSFLYTVGCALSSLLLPVIGVSTTFWLSGVLMIPAIVLVYLSREPDSRGAAKPKEKVKLNLGELFRNKAYVFLLLYNLLLHIGTSCDNSFITYFMEDIGVPTERYGLLLAYRALLEIPCLFLMGRLRRRFSLRGLLVGSALFLLLNTAGLGLFANSFPAMLALATFFGLGNGLSLGAAVNYVYDLAPAHLKASAQAFYASVTSAAGILGNLVGGVLFDAMGAKPFYLAITGMYLFSAGVFVLSFAGRKKTANP